MKYINLELAIDNTNGIIQLIIYHYWMKIVLDQFEIFLSWVMYGTPFNRLFYGKDI